MTNIEPPTPQPIGKRRYRKRAAKVTLPELMERDCHRGVSFLKVCKTCQKVRDREELFPYPLADECSLCMRRKERIREGLHKTNATPNEQRSVSGKVAHAMNKAAAAARLDAEMAPLRECNRKEMLLLAWRKEREQALMASGRSFKDVLNDAGLKQEVAQKRAQLGLV